MKKEEKLELKASDYAISHYESDKTYTSLEVHKMLCDAYKVGANAILDEIEKFATATWGNSLTLILLKKKIKELKGE